MAGALPYATGVWKTVQSADPAANNEFTLTVPTSKAWVIKALKVTLVQGITQTPLPVLLLDDGTNVFYSVPGASAAQAASTTVTYTWLDNGGAPSALIGSGANVFASAGLPTDTVLLGGWRVRSSTVGLGANSDYGIASAYVYEMG